MIAALAVVIGFLTWAAAGKDLPFPVANQLAGTVFTATPLILGALCGVVGERAGVVNVAIEGQFLTAAFAAALVGSVTKSIPAALFAAVLAGVMMASVLALFAIKYLVDQVVLGVGGEAGVVDARDGGVGGQPFGQGLGGAGMGQHPQFQGLQALEEDPGVEGAHAGAGGADDTQDLLADPLGIADHGPAQTPPLAVQVLGGGVDD